MAEGWHSPRLQQPKYVGIETRATAPWRTVREAVKKAYPKMPDTRPTLLVIHDDLFVALNSWPVDLVELALYCPRGRGTHPSRRPVFRELSLCHSLPIGLSAGSVPLRTDSHRTATL